MIEKGPSIKIDSLKSIRKQDRENVPKHDLKYKKKKSMSSTERSLASMRKIK